MVRTSRYNRAAAFAAASLFIFGFQIACFCQEATIQSDFEHKVNLYNVNGTPLMNHESDVKGSPYFLKDWKYAAVYTADNQTFTRVKVRLDLQRQMLHFVNSQKIELVAAVAAVKRVIIFDTTAGIANSFDFQCGYPAIDNQNASNFYLTLESGKIAMLKSIRKSVFSTSDGFSGDTDKEMRNYEDYYFFVGNKMERVKKDKVFVLGDMKDKRAEIEAFLQTNKISFKTINDIQKIVNYYNSLF